MKEFENIVTGKSSIPALIITLILDGMFTELPEKKPAKAR